MIDLLIGCGSSRDKRMGFDKEWMNLVTLDIEARHHPDYVHDLNDLPYPFSDNECASIHAYEVLEHCGRQGDYRFFFAQFAEFWRILVPGGHIFATVPALDSPWAWGDPSHTRVIPLESLVFLNQDEYVKQVGVTSMSDFRSIYKADFRVVRAGRFDPHSNFFILKARK